MEQNQTKEKTAPKRPGFTPVIIIALLVLTAFLGYRNSGLQKELRDYQAASKSECVEQKNLNFALMFIEKVLQADKEIDFETRLQLENAVRDLNDKEILVQWQKFTSSKNEKDAQMEVKNLLKLTIERSQK